VAYTANNVSVTNSLATTLNGVTATTAIKGLTSITQTGNNGASAVTTNANTSNLSIADTGTTPSGAVSVTDSGGSITLSNFAIANSTSGGTVSVTDSAGSITLGAGINDLTNGVTTLTSTGTSAGISDTASSPINIYGEVIFNSDGPINVSNNTASSLGAIQLNATTTVATVNNSNITYTEGGTVNIDQISVPGTYSGTISVTSANANIVEDTLHNIVIPATAKLNLTASSATGQVLLSSTTAANNQISSPVSITATGNSVIWDENNLTLAGVFINTGTFTVNTTGAAGITVGEQAGTTIYSYANDTIKTDGGAVTLTQSGNNFGAITVDTTNGNAAGAAVNVKEYGGNNWASINTGTGGNFTATSETSIVFQSGNAIIGGNTTLAAPLGSIQFTGSANTLNGGLLKVTTTGNASVTDTSGTTVLADGTNVAGTLTVNNTSANGIIKDNGTTGNITAGTAALFVTTSGTGDVSFTGGNNSIANIELKAGSGATNFNDNAAVNILPGTAVNGTATISSGGGITMTTSGPVTFLSTLGLNASSGNITFSDTSVLFNAKVTAVAAGATGDVNFSALSLGTNFNGITPAVTTSSNATYYQAPGP
jgi:hypothetical protein